MYTIGRLNRKAIQVITGIGKRTINSFIENSRADPDDTARDEDYISDHVRREYPPPWVRLSLDVFPQAIVLTCSLPTISAIEHPIRPSPSKPRTERREK